MTNDAPWLIVALDGIVATPLHRDRVDALAQSALLDPDDVHDRLWGSGFVDRCCLGELSLAEMIAGIRDRLAADLTEAHLMGLWSLAYDPHLDAIEQLAAASGQCLGVVADETPLFREAFEAYLPEVDMLADRAWLSSEHHALIDNVSFYESVTLGLQTADQTPTFVAATVEQGLAASAAGWRVVADLRTALSG